MLEFLKSADPNGILLLFGALLLCALGFLTTPHDDSDNAAESAANTNETTED